MKRSVLWTILVIVAIGVLFFYTSTAGAGQQCRVCVEYKGQRGCAMAAAGTAAEATTSAKNTACGPIASGMNESIACGNTEPVLVECKKR
jgi:hypothetical protein